MNNNNLNDSFLREKINELDEIFPQELGDESLLWKDISSRLDQGKKMEISWRWLSAAASVSILIITAIFFLLKKTSEESVITYRTEVVHESDREKETSDSRQEEKEAMDYVNEQCKVARPVCHSEEFIELKHQLAEVEVKLEEIDKQKKLFGPDPALIKAQTVAENQKAYLLKELIQILRS